MASITDVRRMSSHSLKSKRRHPEKDRKTFEVGHVTFEVCNNKEYGPTFALIAGEAQHSKDRKPLFSGHIPTGMAEQLRELAFHIRQIEPQAAIRPFSDCEKDRARVRSEKNLD